MNKSEENLDTSLRDNLMNATRRFTRSTLLLQSVIAGKAGLNVTDAECIDFLMEMGPSTAGDLARITMLTTGAVTNIIDRLEKAGLVRRENDIKDRRKVIVRFLPEKHEQTGEYYTALANDIKELFVSYSQNELDFLKQHMEAMKAIYDKNTQRVILAKNTVTKGDK